MIIKNTAYRTVETGPRYYKLGLSAIGLESEFCLFINDQQVRPEDIFGTPQNFIETNLIHRTGTSYHLPTGGAVYFDTGVIEVMTPLIEIERSCAARAVRSLWESIMFLRAELDKWEKRTGNVVRLAGFSTHYNVSFDLSQAERKSCKTVEKLALLLTYILPFPVMLLATNRKSTGVGVRPRKNRVEVTVDFTPSPGLMIATATLITGIVRSVMVWKSYNLKMLKEQDIPVVSGFEPMKHTSRQGWLARFNSYPYNPFVEDIDARIWEYGVLHRHVSCENMKLRSLREISNRIFLNFYKSIARFADPFTLKLMRSIFNGQTISLLELQARPPEYEDVGRLCQWNNLFPEQMLVRSSYERVLINSIAGKKLYIKGKSFTPIGTRGWFDVVFRNDSNGKEQIFDLDFLSRRLKNWEVHKSVRRGYTQKTHLPKPHTNK